jgi:hypothetical protein
MKADAPKKAASSSAALAVIFVPLGLAFLALGLTTTRAFLGAGALFLIVGIVSFVQNGRSRKRHGENQEGTDAPSRRRED